MHAHFTVRLANPDDAQAIHSIYAPYVAESTATFEVEPPTVEDLRERIVRILDRYPYLVAEAEDGMVIAFAYAAPFRLRLAYDWSVETSVYAAPNAIGRGVARLLYEKLEHLLADQGIKNMYAVITEGNAASERFHEKCGYSKVGVLTDCGFKHGQWLSIGWWEKIIATHCGAPEPVLPCREMLGMGEEA